MNFVFLPESREEFVAAVFAYEAVQPGLGWRFRKEVERVIQRIVANPELWHERPGGYRRVNCLVFPYYVAYLIRQNTVVIVAVGHGHRMPNYWIERIG